MNTLIMGLEEGGEENWRWNRKSRPDDLDLRIPATFFIFEMGSPAIYLVGAPCLNGSTARLLIKFSA